MTNIDDMMIESLQKLIAIPSVTARGDSDAPYGIETKKALAYMLELCESLGFTTKNCENQVGWAQIGEGEELIGILCHLDVVPAGSDWTHPAFGGEIHDGKIFGRGTLDDKGPAVAAVYAMKELLDSGAALNKRIRIIFGQTEESGEWEDMEYYKAHEELPSYGFTPDADFPLIYGEKGILMLSFTMPVDKAGFLEVQGGEAPNMVADAASCTVKNKSGEVVRLEAKGRAAHGSMPEDGDNAISHLMNQLHEMNSRGETDVPFAEFYCEKIGFALDGRLLGCALEDEESGKLSFNVGKISMDEECVQLLADIRYPVTSSREKVEQLIAEGLKGTGVEFEMFEHMRPVYMDKDGGHIQSLLAVYRECTGDMTQPMVIGGGTYARAMDNIVGFGPVFPGRECTEHQRDEYIYIEDLVKIRTIYRKALEKWVK